VLFLADKSEKLMDPDDLADFDLRYTAFFFTIECVMCVLTVKLAFQ
jgi:hypothetical protein